MAIFNSYVSFPEGMFTLWLINGLRRCAKTAKRALHGEGLAGAGLPIGKQTAIVSCLRCWIAIKNCNFHEDFLIPTGPCHESSALGSQGTTRKLWDPPTRPCWIRCTVFFSKSPTLQNFVKQRSRSPVLRPILWGQDDLPWTNSET